MSDLDSDEALEQLKAKHRRWLRVQVYGFLGLYCVIGTMLWMIFHMVIIRLAFNYWNQNEKTCGLFGATALSAIFVAYRAAKQLAALDRWYDRQSKRHDIVIAMCHACTEADQQCAYCVMCGEKFCGAHIYPENHACTNWRYRRAKRSE